MRFISFMGIPVFFRHSIIESHPISSSLNILIPPPERSTNGNEAGVGEGIRTCGIARDELFVTSKVAAENKSYDSAAQSIDETLRKTELDCIDMMIIHSPQPWAEFRGRTPVPVPRSSTLCPEMPIPRAAIFS